MGICRGGPIPSISSWTCFPNKNQILKTWNAYFRTEHNFFNNYDIRRALNSSVACARITSTSYGLPLDYTLHIQNTTPHKHLLKLCISLIQWENTSGIASTLIFKSELLTRDTRRHDRQMGENFAMMLTIMTCLVIIIQFSVCFVIRPTQVRNDTNSWQLATCMQTNLWVVQSNALRIFVGMCWTQRTWTTWKGTPTHVMERITFVKWIVKQD